MSNSEIPHNPLRQALLLQEMILSLAGGDKLDNAVYSKLRTGLMDCAIKRSLVPRCVRKCKNEGQLWDHFKKVGPSAGASKTLRDYIYESFEPLLEALEAKYGDPEDMVMSDLLSFVDIYGVHRTWPRVIQLAHEDPEAAITSAHSLLERVCKQILNEAGEKYGEQQDFLKLYVKTSWVLNLAPSQDTEDLFRAVLGSCQSLVHNLGAMCSKSIQTPGSGRTSEKPSSRHATLAVNLAWSMAAFLLETWQEKQSKRPSRGQPT